MKRRGFLLAALLSAAVSDAGFAVEYIPPPGWTDAQRKAASASCLAEFQAKLKRPEFQAKIKEAAKTPDPGKIVAWGLFCGPLCAIAEAADPSGGNKAAAGEVGRQFIRQCFQRKGYKIKP